MCERLIALLCKVECKGDDLREGGCGYRQGEKCNSIEKLDMCMLGCIADYLLANGVIVPPCKVGDKVYKPIITDDTHKPAIWEITITQISIETGKLSNDAYAIGTICKSKSGESFDFDEIGKTVFLTKEEAEKALKGGAE